MRLTVILFMTAALGCGDDGGASAPPMDGGPIGDAATMDGGPPFDPDMTYEGEGEPCQMSLECARYQICVDDVCRRHERYEADELSFGELRVSTPEMLADTPFVTDVTWPWEELRTDGILLDRSLWSSRQVWTADGPALATFYPSMQRCQALVWDSRVRMRSVDDMGCSAIDATPDGRIALAGLDKTTGRPRVVIFGADGGEPVVDAIAPEHWDAELVLPDGGPGRVALPTSVLIDGDGALISLGVDGEPRVESELGTYWEFPDHASIQPTGWKLSRVAFGRTGADGEIELLVDGGGGVHFGDNGWLLPSPDGAVALLARYSGEPDLRRWQQDLTVYALNVSTGEEHLVFTGQGALTAHLRLGQRESAFVVASVEVATEPGTCGPVLIDHSGGARTFSPLQELVRCEFVDGIGGGVAGLPSGFPQHSVVYPAPAPPSLTYRLEQPSPGEPRPVVMTSTSRVLTSAEVEPLAVPSQFNASVARYTKTREFLERTGSELIVFEFTLSRVEGS